jgi:two-component system, cell cycle response regulator DivK
MPTNQRSDREVDARTPTVILVDDHQDSLEMYALGLRALGIESLTAATPEEAYALATTNAPDIIVADLMLSGSSGLDLARRLRAAAHTRDTGIIVLTGHSDGATRRLAHDAGCDRFLVKPCAPAMLANEIRDLLALRRFSPAAITQRSMSA